MLKHEFFLDEHLDYLRIAFEAPYERLGSYFDADVMNAYMAQEAINLFQPVLDGTVPHVSGNGNSWWFEVGPETTRLGDIFVEPAFEIEVPTKELVELLAVYRDRKQERARELEEK